MKPLVRAAVLTSLCLGTSSASAQADTFFTPFVGKTFAAQTTLPTTARVDKQAWIVGGSATWLTDNVLGTEVDFGYAPRFFGTVFGSDSLALGSGGSVVSLTGNLLLAVPLSVTRESLRPYLSAGLGVLHAGADDSTNLLVVDRNLMALSIGGGAIGFVNRRAGVRFDLRHVRSTSTGLDTRTLLIEPRLGYWRATIGVVIRY